MSDTPRTDKMSGMILDRELCDADFARQLERELAAVTDERDKAICELEMWREGCIVREEDRLERDQLLVRVSTVETANADLAAERDALKHALIELESASEAYAADQSQAADSRCGLVQPITVKDGNRLLSALKAANELTK
jgi:hypothetical protein